MTPALPQNRREGKVGFEPTPVLRSETRTHSSLYTGWLYQAELPPHVCRHNLPSWRRLSQAQINLVSFTDV